MLSLVHDNIPLNKTHIPRLPRSSLSRGPRVDRGWTFQIRHLRAEPRRASNFPYSISPPHPHLLLLPQSMWYPSAHLFRQTLLLSPARRSRPDMDLSQYRYSSAFLLHSRHRKRRSFHRRSPSRLPIWEMQRPRRNITRRRSRPVNIALRRLSLAVVIGIAGPISGALHAW